MDGFERVVEFVAEHSGFDRETLKKTIPTYAERNTYVVLADNKREIAAVCVWDNCGTTAKVGELVIRPDMRNPKVVKLVASLAWKKFPFLKDLEFDRERKYPDRKPRAYSFSRFIGGSK